MDEGFYEEAVLWRCTAEKGITIHFGQEGLQASAVVDLCEYRGYSAVYSVIQYGFSHPDHLEPVDETWVNVTNSQPQGAGAGRDHRRDGGQRGFRQTHSGRMQPVPPDVRDA